MDKAILYGCYAAGKESKDSDLDLAVIPADFGKDRYKEGTMLMKLAWRGLTPGCIRSHFLQCL